jgi:hypothetical protein
VGWGHVDCRGHDPTREAFVSLTPNFINASALRKRHSGVHPFDVALELREPKPWLAKLTHHSTSEYG